MKVCQLIEHPKKTFFFKNYTENEAGKLVSDLFFLGIVSPANFVYDFSVKIFLVLYSIN